MPHFSPASGESGAIDPPLVDGMPLKWESALFGLGTIIADVTCVNAWVARGIVVSLPLPCRASGLQ
jgi:hypothetical protein